MIEVEDMDEEGTTTDHIHQDLIGNKDHSIRNNHRIQVNINSQHLSIDNNNSNQMESQDAIDVDKQDISS